MRPAALMLPTGRGELRPWTPSGRTPVAASGRPASSRVAYAAAHVVADPFADPVGPAEVAVLDWEATLAFRRHVWACGLGVAEAMDTAQRGMGLDWDTTKRLIARTGAEAAAVGGHWCAGVGTDQLPAGPASVDDVVTAWREQLEVVSAAGAVPVIMASRALAATASGPEDYQRAYGKLLTDAGGPVILHWLGEPFDPPAAATFTDRYSTYPAARRSAGYRSIGGLVSPPNPTPAALIQCHCARLRDRRRVNQRVQETGCGGQRANSSRGTLDHRA